VVPGGPAAYFTRLPIKAIAQALRDAGLPAEVSQTAGTFVCNHVFYGLLHQLRRRPRVRAGFMHLPLSPEMRPGESAGRSGLALSEQIRGVRLALEVALVRSDDLALPGGAVD
jgi:pyroglutamyl-peptidase